MNKHLFICSVVVGILLLSSQGTAFAQTPTATSRPIQVRNEAIKEAKEEFKGKIQEARQTYRSERAKIHGERLSNHFDAYEKRLNNIAARIQSHIDKKKADGKDVTSAQTKLDTAKTTLATAVADGKKAVDMFAAITINKWNIQQPEIKAAIDQAQKARGGFIETRKQLIDAAKTLRAIK